MNKKILSICITAVLSMGTLSGCGTQNADAVYFLNFKPESAQVYEEIAKAYEKETGVRVNVMTAAGGTYEQTLKSEIAKADAPTIFSVNGPVGLSAWRSYCMDLSNTELYRMLVDNSMALKDGDAVAGIPIVVEGYGIIYNNAIMKKYFALPDKKSPLNGAEEINSFAELKTVVEDMQAHKQDLGISGVFSSTSLASGQQWRWQTHLANVPFHYEFLKGGTDALSAGLKATDVEFQYAPQFKNLFDLYTANSVTDPTLLGGKNVDDSMAEFALGKTAMVQNGNWAWDQINQVSGNVVKEEDIKFMPLYMGMPGEENQGLCVGTENYIAINKNASPERQQASLDFLTWLFSSDTGKRFVKEELQFITPFSTFTAADSPANPLSQQVTYWMNKPGVETIPWTFQVFPGEQFKDSFGDALLTYTQGDTDWNGVVDVVKRSWKTERTAQAQ